MNDEIHAYWESAELEIKTWKGVDAPCTLGGNIQDLQEKLEEHGQALSQMLAMRYVTPFKQQVEDKSNLLSAVSDTIEQWLKV